MYDIIRANQKPLRISLLCCDFSLLGTNHHVLGNLGKKKKKRWDTHLRDGGDEIVGIPRILLHNFPCQLLLNPRPKEKYYEFSQFNYEKNFPWVLQEIHKCTKLGKISGQHKVGELPRTARLLPSWNALARQAVWVPARSRSAAAAAPGRVEQEYYGTIRNTTGLWGFISAYVHQLL